jgi:uncharacterized membrane protein
MPRVVARDEVALPHQVEDVYAVLIDFPAYRAWWPRLLSFKVLTPGPVGIGTRVRFGHTHLVSWTAVVTDVRPEERIAMHYDGGACLGEAVWTMDAAGQATRIAYSIDLEVRPWYLRGLSHVLDFSREHTRQIYRVFLALDRRLVVIAGERSPAGGAVRIG